MKKNKNITYERRKRRTRKNIGKGTQNRPRLSIFRSNTYIYAQIIDDVRGGTLASASSLEIKKKTKKIDGAREVGKMIAERALKAGVTNVVFDRGRYRYHGRVKALAESAREGKLVF